MGGVETDTDGRTSLAGLYAAGECAYSGVHGANRLASNSLLEAAVFGARAGRSAATQTDPGTRPLPTSPAPDLPPDALMTLRRAMSRQAGLERSGTGLANLLTLIDELASAHGEAPTLTSARLIVEGALSRRESRGAHYRTDFPHTAPVAIHGRVTLDPATLNDAAA
jgi:L-aspartate oxidase